MYFSAEDRGEMMSMVYNWPAEQVFSTCERYKLLQPLCGISIYSFR